MTRIPRSALWPVLALGVTQIIGYGTLYYAYGVVVPRLSADLGISVTMAVGAFSLALLISGLAAPLVGRQIDRRGARMMMAAGSVVAAAALVALAFAQGTLTLGAALIAAEIASTLVLYDAAFAALAQAMGPARARRAITQMTLIGGFASTIFWPATQMLAAQWGWRETYLAFAALHLLVCLPLHLSLPRAPLDLPAPAPGIAAPAAFAPLPPAQHSRAMLWLAVGFSVAGLVGSAVAAQWVPALMALGLSEGAAVAAGAVMGPAQVGVRVLDMAFGLRLHPLTTAIISTGLMAAALALLAIAGPGTGAAVAFALLFGLANGLTSITRGTVPLALFGAQGFAARLGTLAGLRMVSGAVAPFALALSLGLWDARLVLVGMLALVLLAAAALWRVPR